MLAIILLTSALLASSITAQPNDERAFMRYRAAVDAYAILHREAASALPSGSLCGGPEQVELIRLELTREIRNLRGDAHEGDIFDADVSVVLRARLTRALADDEGEDAVSVADFDDPERRPYPIEVNGFFPWESGPPRGRGLFWALPSLPEELEYRMLGRDLLLLDVQARLVVDILRDAIR
jgi:hypothetical protein